jgi:N-acetylmuramoyl-L-alanine amidase
MKINDDGLLFTSEGVKFPFKESPNRSGNFHDPPRFIVAHWTGGIRMEGAVSWLTTPQAKASAHFVVGRDGKLVQLVSVNEIAWHAGPSRWEVRTIDDAKKVYEKLNRYAIGIEFVNLGMLKKTEAGTFISSTGHLVDPAEVIKAENQTDEVYEGRYFQTYTPEQIDTGDEIVSALKEYFPSIEDVIGHHDIAPKRKLDPGPLFPFNHYRARLQGRAEDA